MQEEQRLVATRRRRRVAVACDVCRHRKIRCDGLQPLCSFCLAHGFTCAYHKGPQRVQVSQDYLDALLRQVRQLRKNNAEPTTSTSAEPSCVPDYAPTAGSPSAISEDATSGAETDTIVCAGSPLPATGGSYFGATSTPAFLDVVQAMVSGGGAGRTAKLNGRTTRQQENTSFYSLPTSSIKSTLVPPRWTADHLVETYFTHVSITLTVLHESTFRQTYRQLWQPGSPPPRSGWLCIANGLFALATLFSSRLALAESEATAEKFFAQTQELCDLHKLDCSSLATVQGLLLMSHYMHLKRVQRCWHVVGLAIRVAQGLGLHLTDVNNQFDAVERETRRRCWCACLTMDTMLAVTFGRPSAILPKYYQRIDLPRVGSDDVEDRIQLFTQRVKLCAILQDVLSTLYDTTRDADMEEEVQVGEMARLDRRLCTWLAELPPSLRMDDQAADPESYTPSDTRSVPSRMIYTRYLTARLLLTRPGLVDVARGDAGSNNSAHGGCLGTLDHSLALASAEACVDTAKRLIDHIGCDVRGVEQHVAGATWHNTNCVFTAALVVFSALMVPQLRPRVADWRHWLACVDMMQSLARTCRSAQACLSMLEFLNQHLNQTGQREAAPDEVQLGFPDLRGLSPPITMSDWADILGYDELFCSDVHFL